LKNAMNAAFEGIKPGTEGLGVVRAQLGIRCWVRFFGAFALYFRRPSQSRPNIRPDT